MLTVDCSVFSEWTYVAAGVNLIVAGNSTAVGIVNKGEANQGFYFNNVPGEFNAASSRVCLGESFFGHLGELRLTVTGCQYQAERAYLVEDCRKKNNERMAFDYPYALCACPSHQYWALDFLCHGTAAIG